VNCISPRRTYTIPLASGPALELGSRCLVMGILNVTPDSFADARPLQDPAGAVAAALAMETDGADLIDIGGESTRPGAGPISADEELSRVLPVLEALQGRLKVPISIDTSKADVARAAIAAGAVIVNDVSGLRREPLLAKVVADTGAALVLMHSRGTSQSMYLEADYGEVIAEVIDELKEGLGRATGAGVPL
jgi:dihydropteroate synthase